MSISFSFHSTSEFISIVTQNAVAVSKTNKDAQILTEKVSLDAN